MFHIKFLWSVKLPVATFLALAHTPGRAKVIPSKALQHWFQIDPELQKL